MAPESGNFSRTVYPKDDVSNGDWNCEVVQ